MPQEHIHLDEFAHLKSAFHRFDPRVKLVSCLVFLVIVVSLKSTEGLIFALSVICLFILGAHLPAVRILKRLGLIIPVIFVIGIFLPFMQPGIPLFSINLGFFTLHFTDQGVQVSILFFLRVFCAALLIILVTYTTPFHILLRSLSDLKIPKIFTHLLQFAFRYFFVLSDEAQRMQRARRSRNFKPAKNFWSRQTLSTFGGLLGILFIRSYERGERVYFAMMSRGFKGEIRVLDDLHIQGKDIVLGTAIVLLGIVSLVFDQGGFGWLQF